MDQISLHGGNSLLRMHPSVYQLLKTSFPSHDWKEWLFPRVSPGFWDKVENRQNYFAWLKQKLGYKEMSDW